MTSFKNLLGGFTPRFIRKIICRLGNFYSTIEDFGPLRFPSQELAFRTLKMHGWSPKGCIDIGAYHGEWAKMFRQLFPQAAVLMIEAQDSKRSKLETACAELGPGVEYATALLGADDGIEVEFAEMETGSSVYAETSHVQRLTAKKRLTTLDTLLERHPAYLSADCMKIDTQGYELEVLKGCPRLLKTVDVVLLEVSLLPVNAGCPLFAEVVAFMTANGFQLFDFCSQIRRRDGVLWQTDLLFLRTNGSIRIDPRLTAQNWGPEA